MTITSFPTKGRLTRYGYDSIAIGEHVYAESIAYGELVYEPDIHSVGSYVTAFSFTVNDGKDNSVTASIEFNITVTPNHAPVITGSSHTLAVTAAKTLSLVDLGYSDTDGDALSSVNITVLPERGTLELYGSTVSTGDTIDASAISEGYLTYRPDAQAIASHVDTLSFTASDGAMNSAPSAMIFNATVSTNTLPVVTGSVVTVTSTSPVVLTLPQLGYSDADDDAMQDITLTELPETGALLYFGYPVSVGSIVSAGNIASGYLTYAPDAENQSAHSANFKFTASDGVASSNVGIVTFNIVGNTNTAPTTANTSVSTTTNDTIVFARGNFPYIDADDDAFAHLTIISLPSVGTLMLNGNEVNAGDEISLQSLDAGDFSLQFDSTISGNSLASFSFTVSDGISDSGSATLTATRTVNPENRRPSSSANSIQVTLGQTRFLSLADISFTDPDGDELTHLHFLNLPVGATLVDSAGNSVSSNQPISRAALTSSMVGIALQNVSVGDELPIIFTVSDGLLESLPSVLTLVVVAAEVPEALPRIKLPITQLGRPIVTLAGGFVLEDESQPSGTTIASWTDTSATSVPDEETTIVRTGNSTDGWTYTETYTAEESDLFEESFTYVFVANIDSSGQLDSYTLTITGIDDDDAEGSQYLDPNSTIVIPEDAPLPSNEPNSLHYTTEVTFDESGNIVDRLTGGRYHASDFNGIIDEPYDDEENDPVDGSSSTSIGDYTFISSDVTTLTFSSSAIIVDLYSGVYYHDSGTGTYGYNPNSNSDGSSNNTTISSGSVTGTTHYSMTTIASASIIGSMMPDGTPISLTFTDQWFDHNLFGYQGGGTYTEGETTGTITENGLDSFTDEGTIVLTITGPDEDDWSITGNSSITAFGNQFYDDSWSAPLTLMTIP